MFIATISPRSTGKTTIMAWLLHALHERGYAVTGFDADESEQLYRWWEASPDGSYPFELHRLANGRFHEEAPRLLPDGHIGGVDCGHLENHAGIGWSVLRIADLAIVACAATNSDVERMEELPMDHFIDQVIPKRADKKRPNTWVLLCRVQPGSTVQPKGIRNGLKADGWNVFTTMIPGTQLYASTAEGVPIKAAGSAFDELVTEMETRGLISK
ncbi:plasmid partition protein [Streptomyces sp. NPDC020490]|uniref:plasmid partition protein n=1 Tax=Streptomyces sp. NPDC020490 TaxID=3365078 RepID=UPI0037A3A6E8